MRSESHLQALAGTVTQGVRCRHDAPGRPGVAPRSSFSGGAAPTMHGYALYAGIDGVQKE
ncbi:MAG: hypothetical protein ACLUYV_05255 [Alistipes shahii]